MDVETCILAATLLARWVAGFLAVSFKPEHLLLHVPKVIYLSPKQRSDAPLSRANSRRDGPKGARKTALAGSGGRKPSALGRFVFNFVTMFLLPIGLLCGLAAGAGYFRLKQGPVSINFLVDPIKQGIDSGLPGLSASFDDVILTLADSGGLELRIKDLRLEEQGGEVAVSAPQAAIGLSAGALWGLQVAPERVELIEPRIALFYSKSRGLSFDFATPDAGPVATQKTASVSGPAAGAATVDLAEAIASTAAYTSDTGSTPTLREVGLRNATVVLDAEGRTTFWQVPRLLVDVERRADRGIISGSARVSSSGRIWTASFRLEAPRNGEGISIATSLRDVEPRQIAKAVPGIDFLNAFDSPMSADINARFTQVGTLRTCDVALQVSGTRLQPDGFGAPLVSVDAGVLNFSYDPSGQQVELKPSDIRIGEAGLVVSGRAGAVDNAQQEEPDWTFDFVAVPAGVGNKVQQPRDAAVRSGRARGKYVGSAKRILIEEVDLDVAGGHIEINGEVDTAGVPSARLEGVFSAMPADQLAALWPLDLAVAGRSWVRANLRGGHVKSGTLNFLSGRHLPVAQAGAGSSRFVAAMEVENVLFTPFVGMPEVLAPRVLVRFENETLEVTAPEASASAGGEPIAISNGQFIGSDMLGVAPSGQTTFEFTGPAPSIASVLERPVMADALKGEKLPSDLEGTVSGEVQIGSPLGQVITAQDIGYEIKGRLSEGQIKGAFGGEDITGASLDFRAAPQAMELSGEILVKGVLAKVNWQRIKDNEDGRQPPTRVTARLDDADRRQLGIDLDDMIVGEVPIEMLIENAGQESQNVHVRADLTPAVLSLSTIAWKKPTGREAFLDFDIETAPDGSKTLSNMRITGSNIAIEGEVQLNSKGRGVAFEFPNFSLDLVSRLSVSGKKEASGIWKVAVDGKTFEGRSYFRSLSSVGDTGSSEGSDKSKGFDVSLKIENVLGFEDVALRQVGMDLSIRGGKLLALDGRGEFASGQPLAFELSRDRGRRLLRVETIDAGQFLKLVGFYPNMVGGRLRLEVDLDGRGAAEKTGTLWVERFKVLGDPVVSEVVGSVDDSVPAIARKQHVVRQVIEFDSLRAPFSVGHGQVGLQDASMNGALLGATLRGTVDFNRKVVDLGGTYVLLQGLNNVFGAIPLLGDLLSGPRKEGVFGTNYAIRGSMERPQVFIHPLSALAPGIFREIFQLAPEQQAIYPRQPGAKPTGPGARSSSSPASVGTPVAPGRTIEGWNSTTWPN